MSPEFPGASSFAGEVVHTGRWPKAGVPLDGRTVGIIGTGSSGVQAIPEIAKRAAHLFVFQRTPTYTFPANNRPLKDEYQQAFKASYAKVRKMQRASPAGFSGFRPSRGDPEDISAIPAGTAKHRQPNLLEAPIDEVRRTIEEHGAGMLQNYRDVYIDPEANELACDLYREDVDRLVDDPLVAEALKPVGYPLGCKRQVLDTDYYAAFNRDNVTLVDLRPDKIVEITPDGLRTRKSHYTFDLLIYATGFDAMTGALTQIDITGKNGRSLRREWEHGPRSYLGLMSEGFPNLFTITGPGSPSVLSNVLVSIEQHVDWIADCLVYLRERGMGSIEPQRAAEDAWLAHVNEVAQNTMYTAPTCNSWYLGTNVPGKQRVFMPYVAGVGRYRKACEEIVANGYEGFTLTF
jgi:cyclohexanone monooxygenase